MKLQLIFTLVFLLIFFISGVALATGSYDLSWWTVDNGGGTSIGGSYTLNGTIGQPEAGALPSGGGYTLAGGFWHGGVFTPADIVDYLPLIIR
jgi:uncharacterized membrane protein